MYKYEEGEAIDGDAEGNDGRMKGIQNDDDAKGRGFEWMAWVKAKREERERERWRR